MNVILRNILSIVNLKNNDLDSNPSFVIGINGIDCSGKTTFAKELSKYFANYNIKNTVIGIDDFTNSSVEKEVYTKFVSGLWCDNYLYKYYEAIINCDKAKNAVINAKKMYSLIFVEGIFLYKPQLVDLIDLKIYLDVELSVAKNRFLKRWVINKDVRPVDIYEKIWYPSHNRYVSEVQPRERCELVIDYNDDLNPEISKM